MAKSADEKRGKILEVAKRRFAHYGLAKTTMSEIAKDLALSKALLYYYFPDKNSLYMAVIEEIVEDMDADLRKILIKDLNIEERILEFLNTRIDFLRKYFYIIEYTFSFRKEVPTEVDNILMKAYAKQVELVKSIFELGVAANELHEMDIEENAGIFLNACAGVRMVIMKSFKNLFVFNKEEFDNILSVEKKFARIFLNGLKK